VTSVGQLAGWWRRVGATLIDIIILAVVDIIIAIATDRIIEYVLGFIIGLVYTTVLLVRRGQTVGMMALGTRCVRDGTQTNITVGPAVARYVITEILGITVIGGLLDILWPLWDSKNQTIHDKVAHSLVVRTN
jgi:uncharacterized RDD family membrane protein YckC